jgi:hypothetical protein
MLNFFCEHNISSVSRNVDVLEKAAIDTLFILQSDNS